MAKQRHTPEQIIGKLREAEVEIARGGSVATACKKIAVTEQSYYRWRREYGGPKVDQARRLKELEGGNARLKRLLAEAELDKAILREAASGKYRARRSGARRSSTCGTCSAVTASRSVGRAVCWGSAARRSGVGPWRWAMSPRWWSGWWPWPPSTAGMATGA